MTFFATFSEIWLNYIVMLFHRSVMMVDIFEFYVS